MCLYYAPITFKYFFYGNSPVIRIRGNVKDKINREIKKESTGDNNKRRKDRFKVKPASASNKKRNSKNIEKET